MAENGRLKKAAPFLCAIPMTSHDNGALRHDDLSEPVFKLQYEHT